MLDPKFVRDHPDLIKEAARKKRMEVDVDRFLAVEAKRRDLIALIDGDRAEQNRASKAIGNLPPAQRTEAADRIRELKARLKSREDEQKQVEEEFRALMLRLPNPPSEDVPEGRDDTENVEIRRVGEAPRFEFQPKDHVEIGTELDVLDVARATRMSGSRQYLLKGLGCSLERAVLQLALDHMVGRGFTPFQVPLLVRHEAMEGTAYFPGGEEQAYKMAKDDLYLIGTAEVSLTSIHTGEILEEEELPKRYVALSPCFRREAGAAGKDTRGLYRIHQFWKVEQVIIDRADEELSRRHHLEILKNAEDLLQDLGIPYRVVNVCTGDLGQGQVQKFDIESWMPSRNGYGETHSASRFHDFQARRLMLRYREQATGKVRYCHTLNNTVIASPRVLIPLLENNQQQDGSVIVPQILRPYLNGVERIVPASAKS